MESVISLADCYSLILNSIRNDPGNILVVSPPGRGITEIVRLLKAEGKGNGLEIVTSALGPKGESQRYGLYIDMLEKLGINVESHTATAIEEALMGYFANRKSMPALVFENMNEATPESLDFFIYISDLLREARVPLIGTVRVRNTQGMALDAFLREVEFGSDIKVVRLSPPELRDISIVTKGYGYVLPDDFLSDVFTLCDGNVSMLKYALSYYKRIGIIDQDNRINEAAYRFLPVPPSPDDLYQTLIQDMGDEEHLLLDAMVLFGGSISEADSHWVIGKPELEVKKLLKQMEEQDIIYSDISGYTFFSPQFSRYYSSMIPPERMNSLVLKISSSPDYEKLPLAEKMKMLFNSGKLEEFEKILSAHKLGIAESFPTEEALLSFILEVEPKLSNPSLSHYLKYIRCKTLAGLNRNEEALACFETDDFSDIDALEPKLLLSKIYSMRGEHEKCLSTVDSVLKITTSEDPAYYSALTVKAGELLKRKSYEEARELADSIITSANRLKLAEIEGRATLIVGNILLENQEYDQAEEFYRKALEISKTGKFMDQLTTCLNNMAIISGYRGDIDEEISRYKSAIKTTYSTGNLRVRGYAIFNLMEAYDYTGRYREATPYVEIERSIIENIKDRYLEYLFLRFMARRAFMTERFPDVVKHADRMISVAREIKLNMWARIGESFKIMAESFMSGVFDNRLPQYFSEPEEFQEDFLPLYFLFGASYFFIFDRDDLAEACLGRITEFSKSFRDYVSNSLDFFSRFYDAVTRDFRDNLGNFESRFGDLKKSKVPIVKAFGNIVEILLSGNYSDHKSLLEKLVKLNRENSMVAEPMAMHVFIFVEIFILHEYANVPLSEARILLDEFRGNTVINTLIEKRFGGL